MILSRKNLPDVPADGLIVPSEKLFSLPEKVLQFGTGVLLRGLPDYFIDKANRLGIFNGRIVVVKSTASGSTDAFDDQDGLYTLAIRGIEDNVKVEETIVNSSISRVLSASSDWKSILTCAQNPELKIIISNTTEVGLKLDSSDRITDDPPASFPGKLLSFLFERYTCFNGSKESGMVIIPTELVVDNGIKLKEILRELIEINKLDSAFLDWFEKYNYFCNSLVDRIVPGRPDQNIAEQMERSLGYQDKLLTISEVYRLWAIEGGDEVRSILSFYEADPGVVIADSIEIFRELKLRMLNGTHTLSCGLAVLSGFPTVKAAMDNPVMAGFISDLMRTEIAAAIPYPVEDNVARDFADKVLDRFRNPHIEHFWINITMQFTAKLKARVVPVLLNHYKHSQAVPEGIAAGFAAYIQFMKAAKKENGMLWGECNGSLYAINDDQAEYIRQIWEASSVETITYNVLADPALWGSDLTQLPGFHAMVNKKFNQIISQGALNAIGRPEETAAK